MTLLNTQETAVVRRPDEALRPGRAGGGARPAAGGPARRAGRAVPGWAALAVCCLAQFMVVLDISIVNVALPQMKAGLHLSLSGEQWVVNAYTLTFAGCRARITNSRGSSENGTMSTFSHRSSLVTIRTRAPRAPTQAPTGSTFWSFDHTAILVRCPGSRAAALISTTPMLI